MKVKINKGNEKILRDFFSLKIPKSIYLKNDLVELDYDISNIVNLLLNGEDITNEKNGLITEEKLNQFNELIKISDDYEKSEIQSYLNSLLSIVKVIETHI